MIFTCEKTMSVEVEWPRREEGLKEAQNISTNDSKKISNHPKVSDVPILGVIVADALKDATNKRKKGKGR